MKKSSKLKEILQDANKPTAPPENPFKQTFPVAIPTTKMNPSYGNREIALQVLQDPQKNQLVPIFSSNLYDWHHQTTKTQWMKDSTDSQMDSPKTIGSCKIQFSISALLLENTYANYFHSEQNYIL